MLEAADPVKFIMLEPGYIGLQIRKDGTIKNIEPDVQEALRLVGINKNWIMKKIEDKKFAKDFLIQMAKGKEKYCVEFYIGEVIQSVEKEGQKENNLNKNKGMKKRKRRKKEKHTDCAISNVPKKVEIGGLPVENYQCTICSDIFAHPTSLLCGHSYCFECIFTWYIVHRNTQCPICRQDINQIPTNCQLLLKSQIDRHFEKTQPDKQKQEYQERLKKGEELMVNVKEKEVEMKMILEALANAPSSSEYSYYTTSDEYSDYDEDGSSNYLSGEDCYFSPKELTEGELQRRREYERQKAERKRLILEELRRRKHNRKWYSRFMCYC